MSDQTVPMIGPDGSVADVPLSGMPDAMRAGAKMGVDMVHAGTGSRGVVPQDRYKDALAAGAVPYRAPATAPIPAALSGSGPASPTWGSTPGEILSTITQHAKNLVAGPYHAFTDAPHNAQEQGALAAMNALPGGGGQIGLALNRLLGVSNSVQSLQNAQHLTGDDKVQAYEDAIPIVGPWAKQIETDVANKGAVAGLAGLATDVGLPAGVSKGLSLAAEPMRNAGLGVMNKVVLNAKPRNMKFNADPGQAVLDNTSGVFPTKGAMASTLDDALHNKVGPQIGEAYRKADAAGTTVTPQELQAAIQPALDKARSFANGPGGSAARATAIDELEQSLKPYTDPNRGPLTPSEVWQAKRTLDKNTPWKDFTQRDLNNTKQQVSSGIGGLLDSKIPELAGINRSYQGLVQASKLAADRAARSPSVWGTVLQTAGGGELGHLLGASPSATAAGAVLPAILRSVPVQSGFASSLYRGGAALKSLPSAARSAAILNALKQHPTQTAGEEQ